MKRLLFLTSLMAAAAGCHNAEVRNSDGGLPPLTPDPGGSVYVWEMPNGNGGSNFHAFPVFPDNQRSLGICDGLAVQGGCCFLSPDAGVTAGPGALYSVGTVQLGEVESGTELAQLPYADPVQGYPGAAWTTPLWSQGHSLAATAPGKDLKGFTVSAKVPAHIANLSPVWASPLVIGRNANFPVTWTPDAQGQAMRLGMVVVDSTRQNFHGAVFCQVPDDAGTVTVPQSFLQNFSAGDICQPCFVARGSDGFANDGGVLLRIQTEIAGAASYGATFQ